MAHTKLYQLSHTTWNCRYHIVFAPKYRGKVLADKYIKQEMRKIFKSICKWKGFYLLAWHIGDEHIHLHLAIPPKFSSSYAVALIKGKSSAWIKKKTKKFPKGSLWCRGYYVSTTGLTEYAVTRYIKHQEHHQIDLIQQKLKFLLKK